MRSVYRLTDIGATITMSGAKLIVISAPSGSGKTTIARKILSRSPNLLFSISATTRKRRPNETDGKDYFFLTQEEFRKKIQHGELIEWEQIYDDYYGSLRSEVERAMSAGKSMVFDVDVNGALSIKTKYPKDAVLIFIKPPSIETLKTRLRNRKTESTEIINKRLERVPMELKKEKDFDFIVVNDSLEKAVNEVESIIKDAIAASR